MIRYRWAGILVLTGLVGVATAITLNGAEKPSPQGNDQVRQLLKRVEKLEARVAELEQRVPRIVTAPQGVPQLRIAPEGKLETLPKGWIPREFNGIRYYDVPLTKSPQP